MAMQSPDFTNPTSWAWNATRRSRAAVGDARHALLRRPLGVEPRARAQHQPAAARHDPGAIPGVNANALRPYLGFGTITLYETTGTSRYNSLQTQVERRSTRGVGFSVAYTFSRTTDDGSGRGDILPNAYDDSGYYGISDLDRPHVLVSQVRYRFPTLESSVAPLRWVFGNWDVSGVFQAQSGAPFDVRTPPASTSPASGPGSGNQFYDQIGDPDGGREPIGIRTLSRADLVRPQRVPRAGGRHVRDDAGEELAAPARASGTSTCRSARASTWPARRSDSISASRRSTS